MESVIVQPKPRIIRLGRQLTAQERSTAEWGERIASYHNRAYRLKREWELYEEKLRAMPLGGILMQNGGGSAYTPPTNPNPTTITNIWTHGAAQGSSFYADLTGYDYLAVDFGVNPNRQNEKFGGGFTGPAGFHIYPDHVNHGWRTTYTYDNQAGSGDVAFAISSDSRLLAPGGGDGSDTTSLASSYTMYLIGQCNASGTLITAWSNPSHVTDPNGTVAGSAALFSWSISGSLATGTQGMWIINSTSITWYGGASSGAAGPSLPPNADLWMGGAGPANGGTPPYDTGPSQWQMAQAVIMKGNEATMLAYLKHTWQF